MLSINYLDDNYDFASVGASWLHDKVYERHQSPHIPVWLAKITNTIVPSKALKLPCRSTIADLMM